ncbi:MAG: hypothetical protein O9308_06810 [Beijerinckiaceae bacterium]|nr:hypothetical protein [Beijerinckiaceae bacterium]
MQHKPEFPIVFRPGFRLYARHAGTALSFIAAAAFFLWLGIGVEHPAKIRTTLFLFSIIVVLLCLFVGIIQLIQIALRGPRIEIDTDHIRIASLLFGCTIPYADIQRVTLASSGRGFILLKDRPEIIKRHQPFGGKNRTLGFPLKILLPEMSVSASVLVPILEGLRSARARLDHSGTELATAYRGSGEQA